MKKQHALQALPKAFLAAGLLGAPLLSGCGGSSGSSSPPAALPQARSVSGTTAEGLTATLTESADVIPQNGSVTYTVTLTNPTSQTVTLQLPPTCTGAAPAFPDAQFAVTAADGTIVYPSGPLPLNPCRGNLPLPPSQSLAPGQTVTVQTVVSSQGGLTQPFSAKGTYMGSAIVITAAGGSATTLGPLTVTVQ